MLLFFYRCLEIPLPLLQEWWWNVSDYLFYRNVCLRDTYFLPRSSYWTIFGFWWSHHGWTIGTNASRLVLVNNHSTVDPQMSQKQIQQNLFSIGVGYSTMTIVFFLDIYYCIIIAWTLFYLIASFTALPGLPWGTCGQYFILIQPFASLASVHIVNYLRQFPSFPSRPTNISL